MKPSPTGDTILDIMQERGISRSKLGYELGLSEYQVSHLLTGIYHIDNEMAEKLSDFLGSSILFWLNREKQYREDIIKEDSQ